MSGFWLPYLGTLPKEYGRTLQHIAVYYGASYPYIHINAQTGALIRDDEAFFIDVSQKMCP